MEGVSHLQKDDTVGSGKNSYKGISDQKVKKVMREELIKQGLVMFRTKIDTEVISREYEAYGDKKVQHFTKVKATYKIVNAENPEESIEIESIGHGVDPQDKSAGKAMTYASKNALLDTFIIPTGEDGDKIHSDDIEQPTYKVDTDNFYKIANENGYDNTKVSKMIAKKYKIKDIKQLNKEQYEEMIAGMKANPVKKEGEK